MAGKKTGADQRRFSPSRDSHVAQARTRNSERRVNFLGLEEASGADGVRRCAIVLDPKIIRVQGSLKRPFQGWRYLAPEDAPADLPEGREYEEPLPTELNRALAEIGVL